jgi:hypothetical protein
VWDGGDTPRGNGESTVACCCGCPCLQDPHVHSRHPGPHVAMPYSHMRPHCPQLGHPPHVAKAAPIAHVLARQRGWCPGVRAAHAALALSCLRAPHVCAPLSWQHQRMVSSHSIERCGFGLGVLPRTRNPPMGRPCLSWKVPRRWRRRREARAVKPAAASHRTETERQDPLALADGWHSGPVCCGALHHAHTQWFQK